MDFRTPPWLAFLVGAAIFLIARQAGTLPELLGGEALSESMPWLNHAVIKTFLIVISLIGSLIWTRGALGQHGYRRPKDMKWWPTIWPGFLLGALGTTMIFVTPAGGMDMARMGTGLAIFLSVLYSSISEEVFIRGFIQSLMSHLRHRKVNLFIASVSVPALTSGVLFGCMHLSVYFGGSDALTTVIIMSYATLLGIVAGYLFEKHKSIVPAIIVHIAANAGGFAAGVVMTIARFLLTGELPQLP
ncbi:MAG: CPBP family intramembrane glutamic endopeptidase [bacterium]